MIKIRALEPLVCMTDFKMGSQVLCPFFDVTMHNCIVSFEIRLTIRN